MKKLFLVLSLFLTAGFAKAETPKDWLYVPFSSYTEVASASQLFSSAPIQFTGILISSPALGSSVAIFRSTSPTFKADITTQVLINTDYFPFNTGPTFVPLFELKNTSYTYINKVGGAKIVYFFHCGSDVKINQAGLCPGMTYTGEIVAP